MPKYGRAYHGHYTSAGSGHYCPTGIGVTRPQRGLGNHLAILESSMRRPPNKVSRVIYIDINSGIRYFQQKGMWIMDILSASSDYGELAVTS